MNHPKSPPNQKPHLSGTSDLNTPPNEGSRERNQRSWTPGGDIGRILAPGFSWFGPSLFRRAHFQASPLLPGRRRWWENTVEQICQLPSSPQFGRVGSFNFSGNKLLCYLAATYWLQISSPVCYFVIVLSDKVWSVVLFASVINSINRKSKSKMHLGSLN